MIVLPIQAPVQADPQQGARAPAPPAPLVGASAASGQARNDPGPGSGGGSAGGGAMGGSGAARRAGEAHLRGKLARTSPEPKSEPKPVPRPDPNRPAGPPPAFEANLLEVEREKLRAGYDPAQEAPQTREGSMPDPAGQARAAAAYGTTRDLQPAARKPGEPEKTEREAPEGPDSTAAAAAPDQRPAEQHETVAPAAASPEPPAGHTP